MMSYVTSIILSVVSGTLVFIVQRLLSENAKLRDTKKHDEVLKQTAISNGVLSLLKIQLIEYYNKYMKSENIPTYVYENWTEMYKSYEVLGGNGVVKRMNEDIEEKKLKNGRGSA